MNSSNSRIVSDTGQQPLTLLILSGLSLNVATTETGAPATITLEKSRCVSSALHSTEPGLLIKCFSFLPLNQYPGSGPTLRLPSRFFVI